MSKYGKPEIYSRFLRKDWVKYRNSRIHTRAYIPTENSKKSTLELSCYETQGLDVEGIQEIHRSNIIMLNRKSPMGHCSIQADNFPSDKLSLDKNYTPERHINIVGWEKHQSKEDRNLIAAQLAEEATKDITIY